MKKIFTSIAIAAISWTSSFSGNANSTNKNTEIQRLTNVEKRSFNSNIK